MSATAKYNTLAECLKQEEIAKGLYKIPKQDKVANQSRNELRYKIIKSWFSERGFSEEDEDVVIALGYNLDMFYSETDNNSIFEKNLQGRSEYRKQRDLEKDREDDYVQGILKKLKRNKSRWKKDKNSILSDLKTALEEEADIAAYFYKAEKSLKRQDETLAITPSLLAEEVCILEGDLQISKEDLIQKAEEYLDMSENEKTQVLKINREEVLQKIDDYITKNQKELIKKGLFYVTIANFVILILRYLYCIITLNRVVVSNSIPYILLSICIPIVTWILLTDEPIFEARKKKYRFLILVIANAIATLLQPLYTGIWDTLVVNIFKIEVNEAMTPGMVINLARILEAAGLALGITVLSKAIFPFIFAEEAKEKILAFKLKHKIDTRENKENLYDFKVVNDLDSGKPIIVKERDLYTHTLVLGSSGTGKTSSIYIPQIIELLITRMRNLEMQQLETLKMYREGKIRMKKPFNKDAFNKNCFECKPEYKKEFESIFEKYRLCGATVVAPNNSMNEDILAYASARGIWVNNLDPTKTKPTYPYERLVGMNPFYMPPRFSKISPNDRTEERERTIYIAESANNFADALTAINEMNGSGDQYFTDVNTTVTNAVTTVAMLDASIRGIQVTLTDIFDYITDFSLLPKLTENIEKHFNLKIKSYEAPSNRKTPNSLYNPNDKKEDEEREERRLQEEMYNSLTEKDKKNPYAKTLITVKSRLQKGSKMDEHAEGLRNLLGKLLQDPRVEDVLVNNTDIIDFNEILENNSITVVNTALELGKNTSTCFGQLFILNFNTAVLRRPKNTRTPHFFFEDETARYLSDTIDTMVTLYRQYMVACTFALQEMHQVEKFPRLSYLKNTLLSAGTLIVFGRTNFEDAETISKLGGQVKYEMVQKTTTRSSLFSENPSSGSSERTTPDQKNYADPYEIRYRDFQELTILTTDEGLVLPARFGRAHFVPKHLLVDKQPQVIRRNEMWRRYWCERYPKKESLMTLAPATVIPPGSSEDIKKALILGTRQSVSISSEERAFIDEKTSENLEGILNTQKYHTDTDVDEDSLLKEILENPEYWDENDMFNMEDDSDSVNGAELDDDDDDDTENIQPAHPQTNPDDDLLREMEEYQRKQAELAKGTGYYA